MWRKIVFRSLGRKKKLSKEAVKILKRRREVRTAAGGSMKVGLEGDAVKPKITILHVLQGKKIKISSLSVDKGSVV